MATIVERPNRKAESTWQAKVRRKSYPLFSASFTDRHRAELWVRDLEAEIDAIELKRNPETEVSRKLRTAAREELIRRYKPDAAPPAAPQHTIGEMIDRYLAEILPSLPKSQVKYEHILQWWKGELGDRALNEEKLHHVIQECLDKLRVCPRVARRRTGSRRDRPLAPATIKGYAVILSAAFAPAVRRWDWCAVNPLSKVETPNLPEQRARYLSEDQRDDEGRILQEGELRRLLTACRRSSHPHLYDVVVLALSTGMRRNELLTLRWNQVDVQRGLILLEVTKTGRRREVPLTGLALQLLRARRGALEPTGRINEDSLLFPGLRKHHKYTQLRGVWTKVLEAAEIRNFKFHDLRHSAATYLLKHDVALSYVSKLLGHARLEQTSRYAHVIDENLKEKVEHSNRETFGLGD